MNTPSPELRQLLDRLLDQDPLTRPEMARFEELLDDDDNLSIYLDLTQQEAALPELLAAIPAPVLPLRRKIRLMMSLTLAAAACIVFFLGLQIGSRQVTPTAKVPSSNVPNPSGAPARITGLIGVQWSGSEQPDILANSGIPGQLAIDSGLVEITYSNGVRVTLEGPAKFDVDDAVSGTLGFGKLVADVPKGAEGFRVNYVDGTVVDLGTEFAINARPYSPAEVSVFDGEIELHPGSGESISLFENQSVRHDVRNALNPVQAIPFKRESFVRRLPTRDFAWEVDAPGTRDMTFDVTHLIWKSSDYHAIIKWIDGPDAVEIKNAELRCNGRLVSSDLHTGVTGDLLPNRLRAITRDNIFHFSLNSSDYESGGHWTLHVTFRPLPRVKDGAAPDVPIYCSGVLQLEEGLVTTASSSDFVGNWSYHHLGNRYVRQFHPDGSFTLRVNGVIAQKPSTGSRWTVENGLLRLSLSDRQHIEEHILRDRNTLVFTNRGYENALRQPES